MMHPKLRVLAFLVMVNAVWATAAWYTMDHATWLWATPIALSINVLLLTYDQVLSFTRLNGEELRGQDPWGLLKLVHELCEKFERPRPQVFLIDQPSAQVFCYGRGANQTRLYVTRGTLKLLTPAELRAVLLYQVAVMNSSLNVLNYWLGACLDLFYRLGRMVELGFKFIFGWNPRLAAAFISPWLWLFQHLLLRPSDFRKLDKETAARLESPEDLARALWKMESYAQTQPWADPWVFSHMCIVSPLTQRHWLSGLRIQPSVKSRIQGLIGRYPL